MNPITIHAAELRPALAGLGKIIGKRHTLPVLGCVKIERTKTGHLALTGTDLDFTAIAQLATPDQGEATTMIVPLEDLANITKSCGRDDTLALASIEKGKTGIRFPCAGQILEHRCDSLPVDDFPSIENVSGASAALDASLRRAIHDALACASTEQTRMVINSAFLDVSRPGAHYIVGTDGRHLFSSNSFTLPLADSVILPTHPFLGWRGFNEDGDWRLCVKAPVKNNPSVFEIASNRWRFIGRCRDGVYPNWRHVVPDPKSFTTSIEIVPEAVESVIQTITRLPDHDPLYHALGIEVSGQRVGLLGKSEREQPWTAIAVPDARASGKDAKVFLNRLLLLKALRFGLTRIELSDALSPIRLSAEGRQMIVSPVRTDATPAPAPTTPSPAPIPAVANTNTPPQPAEQPKEETKMPEHNGNTNGAKRATDTKAEEPKAALELAVAQLELVRGDFRNAIAGINKLGDLLKQVQRESKSAEKDISSVRQTIRQLQAVRI